MLAEVMDHALTPAEREAFAAYLCALVEDGRGAWRMATAHLVGTKRTTVAADTTP